MIQESIVCPSCGSQDVIFSKKRQLYICEDCDSTFQADKKFTPRKIFISYGHDEHAELAARLKEDLTSRGHEVWFDLDRLKLGGDWESYIEEGLSWVSEIPNIGRVVLLMTPHSVRRPDGYCLNEIARALDLRLSVLPVMVVWCEPPLSICRIQWLDMQDCIPPKEKQERYEIKLWRLVKALEEDRLDYEGVQSRLLSLLQPLPFDADIAQHLPRFTGRQWVFDRIDAWLADAKASRVFWITGKPGVGKTALACWLCYHRREVAAFHLCRHGHVQKSDPRKCVLSIAYQLSSQLLDYQARLSALNLEQIVSESNSRTLFDSLIVQPLSGNFPEPDRMIVVLIDALDEATEGGKNELAAFIASEFAKTPDWLRLIITSRPDSEVMHPLQGFTPYVLDASAEENEQDIREYLLRELKLYAGGNGVPQSAIETIIARSEGVFLYIEWIRQELEQERLSLERLDEFPQGLGGIYAQFFERQFPRTTTGSFDFFKSFCRPVLEVIAVARESLGIDYIGAIFGWSSYRKKEILDSFGSLFPVSGDQIQPFHKSVLDWLGDSNRAGPYFVSVLEGHRRLADHGWQEYQSGFANMSHYTLAHLVTHLCKVGDWNKLETLLTDLTFIEAKSAAGMAFGLVADYEEVLGAWPGYEKHSLFGTLSTSLPDWIQESVSAVLIGQSDPHPDKGAGPILVKLRGLSDSQRNPEPQEPIYASSKRTTPERHPGQDQWATLVAEMRRTEAASAANIDPYIAGTLAGRVQAFATFVSTHSHLLALTPRETISLAYNHAAGGQVVELASILAQKMDHLWVAREARPPAPPTRPVCLRTLQGHTNKVTDVSLTNDGRIAVSASEDQTIRVWDIASGNCLRTLQGHIDKVTSVALTQDGKTAVSASEDGTLRIWDLFSGRCLRIIKGHADKVTGVALTQDGKVAVSASWDNTIRVWDLSSGRCLRTLEGHTDKATGVGLTPDGKLAISTSADGTLRVWDVAYGKCLMLLRGHKWWVTNVALTPDGRTAASASWDETLRIWDIASGRCLRTFQGHTSWVTDVLLMAGGRLAVSTSYDKTIRVWDIASGRCLRTLQGHTSGVNGVALTSNGKLAISASDDQTLRIWDIPSGVSTQTFHGHADKVTYILFTPDGKAAISTSADKTIRIWNVDSGKCRQILNGHTGWANGIALTPDGKIAVSANWNVTRNRVDDRKTLSVWEVASGKRLRILQGHKSTIEAVVLTPDGKIAITASWDKTLRVWDVASGHCLHILQGRTEGPLFTGFLRDAKRKRTTQGHTEGVTSVTLTQDGKTAISATWDKSFCVWDIISGKCLLTLQGRTGLRKLERPTQGRAGVALTPDGKVAVSASWDKILRVWDVASGACLQTLQGNNRLVESVVLTPDGRTAISTIYDKSIHVWDVASGSSLRIFQGHTDDINGVMLTYDGKVAVSASDDRTIRVWDVATGECLAIYHAGASVTSISRIRLDGQFACGTADGQIHFLTLRHLERVIPILSVARLFRLLVKYTIHNLQPTGAPLFAEDEPIPGQYDTDLTAGCPWCCERLVPSIVVLEAIAGILRNANLSTKQSPCLALPVEAWNEPRLLSECPHCHNPLKFNPFIVDNGERY